jgi:hypothetical protein
VSRPARWECEACRRLLAEIECGRLRIARAVEVVYAVEDGCCVVCPACDQPRIWRWVVTVAS